MDTRTSSVDAAGAVKRLFSQSDERDSLAMLNEGRDAAMDLCTAGISLAAKALQYLTGETSEPINDPEQKAIPFVLDHVLSQYQGDVSILFSAMVAGASFVEEVPNAVRNGVTIAIASISALRQTLQNLLA